MYVMSMWLLYVRGVLPECEAALADIATTTPATATAVLARAAGEAMRDHAGLPLTDAGLLRAQAQTLVESHAWGAKRAKVMI